VDREDNIQTQAAKMGAGAFKNIQIHEEFVLRDAFF
jgi:hypothetical protein